MKPKTETSYQIQWWSVAHHCWYCQERPMGCDVDMLLKRYKKKEPRLKYRAVKIVTTEL